MPKVHQRDIRLRNNAGIDYPVCRAETNLLNTELRWQTTGDKSQVTCKHCQRMYKQRYPWAS